MLNVFRRAKFIKADYLNKYIKTSKALCNEKNFAIAMAEALDNHNETLKAQLADLDKVNEQLKETRTLKKVMMRRKWIDWEDNSRESKRVAKDPSERIKRRKFAMLVGYCGANYFGMQRNPGMETIEEELFKAMLKHEWITQDGFDQAQVSCFQRAARTDKGVSAARQVCSIKIPDDLNVKTLNDDLPDGIRLFAVQRVTKGFNAKDQCNARTYTYTLPTIAFNSFENQLDYESFRINETQLKSVRETLALYEGTKNFHNFTSKKNFHDPSAKRFIMSFTATDPFVSPDGLEFITLTVKGQSFMLHQIRKMIGLAIAIIRGNTNVSTLTRAITEERLDLPMAPGLGLVLDTVHYERYNERYGSDGIHEPLLWNDNEEEVKAFVEKYIFSKIYETEFKERPLLEWLSTLGFHTYAARIETDNSSSSSSNSTITSTTITTTDTTAKNEEDAVISKN